MSETKTIQVFPSGVSYAYTGDPHGPADQRALKFNHQREDNFRPGTPEEWRDIRIQLRAEGYLRHEILCCQSSLVDDLIKDAADGGRSELARAFEFDNVENIYADPGDWDADRCREYLSDYGGDAPDTPTVPCDRCDGDGYRSPHNAGPVAAEASQCETCHGSGEVPDPDADEDASYVDALKDAVREHAQENPAEVYEWWLVSRWLCQQLRETGRVVLDNDYGYWWGRTCTGQALIMDGVLQELAAAYEDTYNADRVA